MAVGRRTSRSPTRRSPRRSGRVRVPEQEAGDLLALEALDQSGLAVNSSGVFVRYLEVSPPNPLIMGEREREQLAAALRRLISRLRGGQWLQFYVETRPVQLGRLLERLRGEVRAFAGEPPSGTGAGTDALALARWRLYAAMEDSLRRHADEQAAVQQRVVVVVPTLPRPGSLRERVEQLPAGTRLLSASLDRDLGAHRRAARQSLAHTDAIRTELEAAGMSARLLNGEEVAALIWRRFNPTRADAGRGRLGELEIAGELDGPADADEARQAASRLREQLARSPIDFSSSRHHAVIDRDAEQVIYAKNTAETTELGWLLGAMMTAQPYVLSVFVHALDRGRERTRLKLSYRRTFMLNRTAEAKGRVPDFDRYAQEQESELLLREMAGADRARVWRVSVYQAIRAPGPEPDLAALSEAVDYCAEQMTASSDCKVSRGEFQQERLWPATLPLARDTAGCSRKYVTRNAADTIPLLGMRVGSPQGIGFALSQPGRTVELLDPYDRSHANQTMLINGKSGAGKTMTGSAILGRCLAMGARAFVLDRAGHYEILTRLVDGARHIHLGADDSPWAINPWDLEDPASPSAEKVTFLKSLHGLIMGEQGLTVLERAQLDRAIRDVYARAALTGQRARESMLYEVLIERSEAEKRDGNPDLARTLRDLAERISEFCADGSYAYLLDRDTNVPPDSSLVVFDTRSCPKELLRVAMFQILEYVKQTVKTHYDGAKAIRARPDAPMFAGRSVVLIDEAWHLVGRQETGEYANDLAKRARHWGLFLIAISQQLSDFDTEHGRALIRNSTMQLLLQQHADEIPHLQEMLRLSDQEARIVERLKTVKGKGAPMLWINGERGRGEVELKLGWLEYWAYTSDPLRDVPVRDAMIERCGGDVWQAIAELAKHGIGETA